MSTPPGDRRAPGREGDLQILTRIFETRLQAGERGLSGLASDERAGLIARFAGVLRRLSELLDITAHVEGPAPLDRALNRLMDIITDALEADRSTLFLFDPETGELFSRIAQGGLVDEIRIRADAGIAGAVFSTGSPIIIHEAYGDSRFNPEVDRRTGYRTESVLCVPVTSWDGRLVGVAQVLNKRRGRFTDEDLALLEALTSHAAAVLGSAHLQENIDRARHDEHQLLGVSQALSSELHLDALLEKIVAITSDVLDAERSTLFLHDPDTDELRSRVADSLELPEIRIPAGSGLAGSVFRSGQSVNIPDAYADPRFNQEVDRRTGFRTRSILCVPVVNRSGDTVGVIQVLNKRGGAFGPRDERRLRALAAQAAVALDNARLFAQMVSERNLNAGILRNLSNGVLALDGECRVRLANRSAEVLLGAAPGGLDGRPLEAVLGPGGAWVMSMIQRALSLEAPEIAVDASLALPDGRTVAVNATVEPVTEPVDDAGGGGTRLLLVLEDLGREKRLRATMARYMPHEVVEKLLSEDENALGGVTQEVSILFADIGGFTGLAERMGPRETMAMLNAYFSEMTEVIFEEGGIVDKYIGDAVMAVFGAPLPGPDHAERAVRAAVGMRRRLASFNAERRARGAPELTMRIGVSSGEVVAGNVGSPRRMDYTVIGDGVNLAARLEQANKRYGTSVLVSETTRARIGEAFPVRLIDRVLLRGAARPVRAYEVLDPAWGGGGEEGRGLVRRFETGLEAFRTRRWEEAVRAFDAVLAKVPGDQPALRFRARARHHLERTRPRGASPPSGG